MLKHRGSESQTATMRFSTGNPVFARAHASKPSAALKAASRTSSLKKCCRIALKGNPKWYRETVCSFKLDSLTMFCHRSLFTSWAMSEKAKDILGLCHARSLDWRTIPWAGPTSQCERNIRQLKNINHTHKVTNTMYWNFPLGPEFKGWLSCVQHTHAHTIGGSVAAPTLPSCSQLKPYIP